MRRDRSDDREGIEGSEEFILIVLSNLSARPTGFPTDLGTHAFEKTKEGGNQGVGELGTEGGSTSGGREQLNS
jgi:hypothetical protein